MTTLSTQMTTDFLSDIVSRAQRLGATDAEAIAMADTEFNVEVRLGEVEKLEQSDSRGLGLRVICEGRQATASTSDLSTRGIEELLNNAVTMARATSVDEDAVLPTREELFSGAGVHAGDHANTADRVAALALYDEELARLDTGRKIDMARAAEAAARAYDPRITNSEGASFASNDGRMLLVSSAGFAGEYRGTSCYLGVAPIASQGEQMQVGGWSDSQRRLATLDAPEQIGRIAAVRALRKLNARKVATQEVPVIFDAAAAEELLDDFFEAVSGDSIFRHSSFLTGQLGEKIAAEKLSIIDDGTMPGAVGSRPFDGEGLATRRTVVVENGVLRSYLLNTYTARKLGLKSTANASRSLAGLPGVGSSNFYIAAGESTPEQMIASIPNGFYVTELIGFGFNPVNGDYSRGASGLWIENGELTFAVEEVTVAGNFRDMLRDIEMIGNDLRFRGGMAAPSIKISHMMVSGD
ncbi:MAG: TldD/PmbA family protein [Blastocatellia bacterium]